MKNLKKLFAICLSLILLITCVPAAFAAEVEDATIDMDAECSLTIWKYDFTNARKDGVWNDDSFISTGWRDIFGSYQFPSGSRCGTTFPDQYTNRRR